MVERLCRTYGTPLPIVADASASACPEVGTAMRGDVHIPFSCSPPVWHGLASDIPQVFDCLTLDITQTLRTDTKLS